MILALNMMGFNYKTLSTASSNACQRPTIITPQKELEQSQTQTHTQTTQVESSFFTI